jgi:hypothetical protein
MKRYAVDSYVVDVLMPDLVGHDRKPAAFVVYLCLLCESEQRRSTALPLSLQEIAARTGLAKSTVQSAIRHLKRRRLIDPTLASTTADPVRRIVKPWLR